LSLRFGAHPAIFGTSFFCAQKAAHACVEVAAIPVTDLFAHGLGPLLAKRIPLFCDPFLWTNFLERPHSSLSVGSDRCSGDAISVLLPVQRFFGGRVACLSGFSCDGSQPLCAVLVLSLEFWSKCWTSSNCFPSAAANVTEFVPQQKLFSKYGPFLILQFSPFPS